MIPACQDQAPQIPELRLAELLGALSHALDMVEGQPAGHCVRCCWIGIHIGREMGLPESQIWELYYTLLMKDVGCSSNAARICQLYMIDDIKFKRDFKTVSYTHLDVYKRQGRAQGRGRTGHGGEEDEFLPALAFDVG